MTAVDNIKIFVLYSSDAGLEKSFFDIARREEAMDIEHYAPRGFWGISGGLEIVIDNYHSILRSTDFYYVVKATNFLIHTMYWIQGKTSDRFDADDDYPNDVVLRTTGKKELRLANNGVNNEVLLSFTPGKQYENGRGSFYFENVAIKKSAWINAVKLAIDEYFEVLLRIIEEHPADETTKTMLGYYEAWKDIDKTFD